MKHVYWFKELDRSSLAIAGGKGANLGEMFNHGLPVPEGFIVSADSYFSFIRGCGLDNVIKELTAGLDSEDTGKLEQISVRLKQAIVAQRVPDDIRAEIVSGYNRLCGSTSFIPAQGEEVFVAVRSSATAEDLPEASFAGQQATFLNVKGADNLVQAVKACWASLFEARAIYYRAQQHFDNLRVGIAVVVQRMVQSDKSGVMFSVDPVGMNEDQLVIEAGFGLGEAVVSGAITPDLYVVDKPSMKIIEKQVNRQDMMIVRSSAGNQEVRVPDELQEVQKLSEDEILQLAAYGVKIEQHYSFPQDMEWAIEGKRVYIVQSRAITTLKRKQAAGGIKDQRTDNVEEVKEVAVEGENKEPAVEGPKKPLADDPFEVKETPLEQAKEILHGIRASPGIAWGPVKVMKDMSEITKVYAGDILVTRMTTPDFVPAMKKASGIVTDEGGATCHASIVSRELGIPCVVGTREATKKLKDGDIITVDAFRGVVYEGRVAFEEEKAKSAAGKGSAAVAGAVSKPVVITGTKIYVNLAEPEKADQVAAENVDGVGLLRAEFMLAGIGKHPKMLIKEGRQKEFVDSLAKGLRKFCAAFSPRPVIYRATDFKTNEYRNLEGGAEFEPQEENPMIGFRGCFRYVKEPEVFALELEAIKKVREQYGMTNLWLMIPFVRRVHEYKVCKEMAEKAGLKRNDDFKMGIMCEIPSTVILADEFCEAGLDFFSIGSNDLTQLTLGVDRDSPTVAEDFDERDHAVMRSLKHVIETCHKYGVKVGICGQAPSVYPEFAEALVRYGIDSISVNPDVIELTRERVASVETKIMLERLKYLADKDDAKKPGEW
ncbi:MAG: phosphoenolpyruvate synthase [Candidatus Micrarchaeota archaeon]